MEESPWLEVIGKALAFLCVQQAALNDPKRVADLPAKVKFLEDIGLNTKEAARLMGTTANSVKTNLRRRGRNGAKRGKAKKKR